MHLLTICENQQAVSDSLTTSLKQDGLLVIGKLMRHKV